MANAAAFDGYRWEYFAQQVSGARKHRADTFITTINWCALSASASALNKGQPCNLLPGIGLGGNHMVRILEFEDGRRWVARLRLPSLHPPQGYSKESLMMAQTDYATASLARSRFGVPVPMIHHVSAKIDGKVGAPYMLMDCLPGNVAMDLGMQVPEKHERIFFNDLAKIQVRLAMIHLPRIGTILSVNDDGTCQQGPIPGLGGPFDTATEYFAAWASTAKFPMLEERLRGACGEYFDEVNASIASFPDSIAAIADRLSGFDHGPFPLCHGDFGHNNVIVDDNYKILGVIDWEHAFAGPWEVFADFPLTLTTIPPAMDVPWNYDDQGFPTDDRTRHKLVLQEEYIRAVSEEEDRLGLHDHHLSLRLRDTKRRNLATGMTLFTEGKPGWFSRLVDGL